MKTLIKLSIFLFIAFPFIIYAQQKQAAQKETIKVWGNCEMCQSKIEKAAKSAGAGSAKWDVDSKILAVSYNPAKSSTVKIEKAIAAAGYDTEHEKAADKAYNELSPCCQYDRKEVKN